MRNPTQGMAKRFVTRPMGEIRLKWKRTRGPVPTEADRVAQKESRTYCPSFLLHGGL